MENIFRSSLIFSEELVSTQENNTHDQCIAKEREVLKQNQRRMQIPIPLEGNETDGMLSTNNGSTPIDGFLNEILDL